MDPVIPATGEAKAGDTAPVVATRPDTIPEKFWDAAKGAPKPLEDVIKSYVELEKLRSSKDEPKIATGAPAEKTEAEKAAAVTEAANVAAAEKAKPSTVAVLDGLLRDFEANGGKLSDAQYEELKTKGIDQETANAVLAGKHAIEEKRNSDLAATVGGMDKFNTLAEFANKNLPKDELKVLVKQLSSKDDAEVKVGLKYLKSYYESVNGSKPSLVDSGGSSVQSAGFDSQRQATDAVKDKRYGKDKTYTAEVTRRLSLSTKL